MRYPKDCPVFRVHTEGEKDIEEWHDAIVVGVDIYTVGVYVLVMDGGPSYFDRKNFTGFHTSWLRPLTPAAKNMIKAVKTLRRMCDAGDAPEWA